MSYLTKSDNRPLQECDFDHEGSLICGIKLEPEKSYSGIPSLLQDFIHTGNLTSWSDITSHIEYLYQSFAIIMHLFDENSDFMKLLKEQLHSGKKLVFKPNLVAPNCIDEKNQGESDGWPLCTEWALVAAIMRWFHDNCNILYSQMALAEGSTMSSSYAFKYSSLFGENVPSEAVFEGRFKNHYAGWGFYFVRRYLMEHRTLDPMDNPMNGYEESCNGTYLAPGEADGKLMVYDINKIQDDRSKGRVIPVPDGKNYSQIMLHKVIVGGEPGNARDLKRYPGCILINLPKNKMHAQDLLTNAIKNIGIGLYPSECAASNSPKDTNWLYASPNTKIPNLKGKLPHSPWVMEMDENTHLPKKDSDGNYIRRKTSGFNGTELDVIKAVQNQNVLELHISDNINIQNLSHDDGATTKRIPEGFLWVSGDCVALDSFCANYCFKTIPRNDALKMQNGSAHPYEFLQKIPIAVPDGKQIVTRYGADSPLLRYSLYKEAEKRGIGTCTYHVSGYNLFTNHMLRSYHGHLAEMTVHGAKEMLTDTLFFNNNTMLHDMQATFFSYAKASDQLHGTNLYQTLLNDYDENHDGVIDYDEKGWGYETAQFGILSHAFYLMTTQKYGNLIAGFLKRRMFFKYSDPANNPEGHDFFKEKFLTYLMTNAYYMSQMPEQQPDKIMDGVVYGRGNWPSLEMVDYTNALLTLYGTDKKNKISLDSLYGLAFQYCDKVTNQGLYTENTDAAESAPDAIQTYHSAVGKGAPLLGFTLYVPAPYETLESQPIPNVEETDDPSLIYTVHFIEIW